MFNFEIKVSLACFHTELAVICIFSFINSFIHLLPPFTYSAFSFFLPLLIHPSPSSSLYLFTFLLIPPFTYSAFSFFLPLLIQLSPSFSLYLISFFLLSPSFTLFFLLFLHSLNSKYHKKMFRFLVTMYPLTTIRDGHFLKNDLEL